jgi:hypothetical protein
MIDLNNPVVRMLLDQVLGQQSTTGPAPMARPGERPAQVGYVKEVEVLAVRTEPEDPDDP